MVAYYEEVTAAVGDGKQVSNRLSDLVMGALNERKEEIDQFPITARRFAEFMKATASVNQQDRRDVFKHMLRTRIGRRDGDGGARHQVGRSTSTKARCGKR